MKRDQYTKVKCGAAMCVYLGADGICIQKEVELFCVSTWTCLAFKRIGQEEQKERRGER